MALRRATGVTQTMAWLGLRVTTAAADEKEKNRRRKMYG
jgi:hypothetical protein